MIHRAFISAIQELGNRLFSKDTLGLSGEVFDAEVFDSYGFTSNPEDGGETLAINILGDPDHKLLLPPRGEASQLAEVGTTKIYYGADTKIVLSDGLIIITLGDKTAKFEGDLLTTDFNIETTGTILAHGEIETRAGLTVANSVAVGASVIAEDEVRAGDIKLTQHKHGGVKAGVDISGKAQ